MTVPVEVRDKERMAMTVPINFGAKRHDTRCGFSCMRNKGAVPKPVDSRVRLVTIPDETVAILQFSGSGRDFAERQSERIGRLAGLRWRPIGEGLPVEDDPGPQGQRGYIERNALRRSAMPARSRPAVCVADLGHDRARSETAEIDLTKWGVAMARKGGVSPDRVLNALDLTAFRAHIEARKRSKFRENLGPRASVPSF